MAAVFSGNEREGYRYVLGSRSLDVRENGKLLNEAFHGRGEESRRWCRELYKGKEKRLRRS